MFLIQIRMVEGLLGLTFAGSMVKRDELLNNRHCIIKNLSRLLHSLNDRNHNGKDVTLHFTGQSGKVQK